VTTAELITELRELHRPFGIYDECGHDHTEEQLEAGDCLEIDEVGLTCEDGLMYQVCEHCCIKEWFGQTEDCASDHKHGKGEPICATAAILERVDAV
jgi:hypothetical protein